MFILREWRKCKAKETYLVTKRGVHGVGFVGICAETPHTANGPPLALFVINMVMRVYEAKEAC